MSETNPMEILLMADHAQDLALIKPRLKRADETNRTGMARDGAEAWKFFFSAGDIAGPAKHPKVVLPDFNVPSSTAAI